MKMRLILAAVAVMCIVISCTKDHNHTVRNKPVRKVHYELFTTENFSEDQHDIQFNLFMRDGRRTIFDSALAIMKIKDIPDSLHRLVFDKIVPGNSQEALVVGFTYHIVNVGFSWFLDEYPKGDTLKVIKYSFK
jgi:hypothetical protein